jgi:hypothetical protein
MVLPQVSTHNPSSKEEIVLPSASPSPRFKNRPPASLTRKLDHTLRGYATAATATGVSLLALAQPGRAEIIYTPTHQTITPRGTFSLDLNNDGVVDFRIDNGLVVCGSPRRPPECSGYTFQSLLVFPYGSNKIMLGNRFAPALPSNVNIGPTRQFNARGSLEQCTTDLGSGPFSYGPWLNARDRYLGLELKVNGETHYGWARLTVTVNRVPAPCHAGVILTGYAYETVPNKPIASGHTSGPDDASAVNHPPTTLGALAIGRAQSPAWRRDGE